MTSLVGSSLTRDGLQTNASVERRHSSHALADDLEHQPGAVH